MTDGDAASHIEDFRAQVVSEEVRDGGCCLLRSFDATYAAGVMETVVCPEEFPGLETQLSTCLCDGFEVFGAVELDWIIIREEHFVDIVAELGRKTFEERMLHDDCCCGVCVDARKVAEGPVSSEGRAHLPVPPADFGMMMLMMPQTIKESSKTWMSLYSPQAITLTYCFQDVGGRSTQCLKADVSLNLTLLAFSYQVVACGYGSLVAVWAVVGMSPEGHWVRR